MLETDVVLTHRLLLVDVEDRSVGGGVADLLASCGFDVQTAGWPNDTLPLVASEEFDAIIVACGSAREVGHDVCRVLRGRGAALPVVVIGCCHDATCEIGAFQSGASDFVLPPLHPPAFAARLRSHITHHRLRGDAGLRMGRWEFNPRLKRLTEVSNGRRIRLTDAEVSLIRCLYWAPDRYASKGALLMEALGYNPTANTHTVETHIYRLRRKIEKSSKHPEFLVTEPHGYRLAADLGRQGPLPAPSGTTIPRSLHCEVAPRANGGLRSDSVSEKVKLAERVRSTSDSLGEVGRRTGA